MRSHELARKLLELPDLPIATHANNHTWKSKEEVGDTYSELKVGLLHSYAGDHLCIGNLSKRNVNKPSMYITEMYVGECPEEW